MAHHKAFAAAAPDVSLFDFKGHQIRVVTIGGEPWFVAKDALKVLTVGLRSNGKPNTTRSLGYLDDGEKGVHQIHTLGGPQRVSIVSESGLYKLVLRSDKPEAKPFQDWVTKEVLPAIRKDGAYIKGEEKVQGRANHTRLGTGLPTLRVWGIRKVWLGHTITSRQGRAIDATMAV